ncbi:MAG: NADH-quinone oxidoreductase subunit NuoF [bacterium]
MTVNLDDRIKTAKEQWKELQEGDDLRIWVGSATCGLAAGAKKLLVQLPGALADQGLKARIVPVGCIGMCFAEPLVDIQEPGKPRVSYRNVTAEALPEILEGQLKHGGPPEKWVFGTLGEGSYDGLPRLEEQAVLKPQLRIALRNCGWIDPTSFDHYLARGGYQGLQRALSMTPEEVIEEVVSSGLRGRGGGGFPTGVKWRFCRGAKGDQKYLICNADEGDPGAFMDRSVLEGDPHSVLEGMIVAAYAIGASVGYIYIRAEYPLAVKRLRHAMDQMREANLLGDDVLGSGFDFEIKIKEGAGAFVCGEETALIASIEGQRGMPRPRPPFPANKGLFGKPSNVNNVETFGNVATILREGANWFSDFGTTESPGTKTFALTGKVKNPGLIEVPMGITLREVVYGVGGGITDNRPFKAAQTGGPSGGCLPERFLDTPIEYATLAKAGSIMGSGGLVIMDDHTCTVDIARYFLSFTQNESCGKCTPCRVGTREMLTILERICDGKGQEGDIELLEELGESIKNSSLCGLGQTAPNPTLTTIKYFREEYEAHIRDRTCPGLTCKALLPSTVDPEAASVPAGLIRVTVERCDACGKCVQACAVAHSKSKDPELAMDEDPPPRPRVLLHKVKGATVPRACRHCEAAACVLVCPTGAMRKTVQGGPVLCDDHLCIGCQSCVLMCPYGVPEAYQEGEKITKCDLCIDRLERGGIPACVEACPTTCLEWVKR